MQGKLSQGVQWNGNGGRIRVEFTSDERPKALSGDSPDNRIIGVAWKLQEKGHIFISKDINCRLKSDALGLPTEDFEAQKVDADTLYSGLRYLLYPVA